MTADSLKSFITLPTTTIYKKSGNNSQKAKLFCFSLFLAIFCVTVSCYQIWNFLRTNELRTEVDLLRDKLETMRKRMGLDMFDDLDDFENVYDPAKQEDDENGIFSDDLSDFDEDIEDEEYDTVYDLDNEKKPEDEEDDDIEAGSGFLKFLATDDYDIYHDERIRIERKPRAVPPHEGVPIIEESYALRRNKTNTSADDQINEVLLKKTANPKMNYDWTQKSGAGDRHPGSHSPRRALKKHHLEHRAPPTLYVSPPPSETAANDDSHQSGQFHIRHSNHHGLQQQLKQRNANRDPRHKYQATNSDNNAHPLGATTPATTTTASVPEPIHVRTSRVMATNEDKSQAFRQIITKREYARLKALQNPNQFVESVAHPEMIAYPPRRLARKSASSGKVARQVSARPRLIAVQYNGDTSRYNSGRHEHYHANGLLRHAGGVYHDWATAPWANSMGMDKYFTMDAGVVTIRENGLYYIYAQIYYKDEHDTNGFVIEHNENLIMQCSTMTHSSQRVSKTNTCHTGGVTFLRAGDTVKVVDLGHNRFTIFEAGKSFFGLVKLAGFQHHSQLPGSTDSATSTPNFF